MGAGRDDLRVAVALKHDAGGGVTAARAFAQLRRASPAAMYAAVLSVGGSADVTDAVLAVDGHALERQELVPLVILGPAAAGCAALGALILAQHPRNLLGLSFVIGGFCTALSVLVTAIVDVPHSRDDGLLRWAAWIDNWIFVGLVVLVTWPLLLFPDG